MEKYICIYIYISCIYIYIYKSGHKWSTTHRVLKSHRSKMSIIYILSWKQCALPVSTTMALWQLMHLGTWCTVPHCWYQWSRVLKHSLSLYIALYIYMCVYIYNIYIIYIYIYIYIYIVCDHEIAQAMQFAETIF